MRGRVWLAGAAAVAMIAAACGGGRVTGPATGPATEGGELGTVEIAPGAPIKIATIQTISGGTAPLGQDQVTAVRVAIDDRGGKLLGHPIELQVEDGGCSAEGGTTAAQKIVSDPQNIGIVGTSCSGAGVPASQVMSEAGLVMISGSTTSPSLTALPYLEDTPLKAEENWQPGFFRVSHNDEFQGHGAAQFAFEKLKARKVVTVHDGDPYTQGLTTQFGKFFQQFGGTVVLATAINKGDTDMRPLLTEAAAATPDLIFMPIFQPEADFIVQQSKEFERLSDVTLMGADGLLAGTFTTIGETAGMYFSGPAVDQGTRAYDEFVEKYTDKAGTPPIQAFHAHAYDAANILLDAVENVAERDGDTLIIDRQALRDWIYDLQGYTALTGTLSCNRFGDCAQPRIGVYKNDDPSAGITGVVQNVVFTSSPEVDPAKLK